MSRWSTEKHFTSWLTLAPNNKISGGRLLSSKTQPSANRAAAVLRRLAAYVVMDHVHALLTPLAGYELKRFCIPESHSPPVRGSASISALGGSGRTSPSTGSFAMMGSLPRSLDSLPEIPGSAGLSSGTTLGSGRWAGERL